MKLLATSALLLFSLSSFANTMDCLDRVQSLFGSDERLILQETSSSDGNPLVLELTELTIRHSTQSASVNSIGRKEGANSGLVVRRTTGNFDITDCRITNSGVRFKMGSVSIRQISSSKLRASVLTWSSEFEVIL